MSIAMGKGLRAVLVGPDQQDNLALRYLASAAEAAGHGVELAPYNYRNDLEGCVASIIAARPELVGLGMAFQYSIQDYLDLASRLRERGYRGHITCGGHVPTFCFEEVLRDAPAIDTVVRHEGERTLADLLDSLARGDRAQDIPGLVWRGPEGIVVGPHRTPVSDLDSLPFPKRRPVPLAVGGVPVAFAITARGCTGSCAYCSIQAFSKDMGRGFRLRDPEPVAEELFGLYRDAGVRIFCVQDDLFILPDEEKALARLGALTETMRGRGIEKAVFWVKGRPESITDRVVKAAQDMGAIHFFLGIENASAERLEYLGRIHTPEDNRRAIASCLKHGVIPSFNFMLFDPDCTLDDVSVTLDFAGEYPGLPWNICRTEIYSGTRLLKRLQAEGRLEGDYKSYGYRMADSRAETVFRILRISLNQRAFMAESLMNRLISLSFARQVHRVFYPDRFTAALDRQVESLSIEIRRDTIDEIRRAIDFVNRVGVGDKDRIRDFAVEQATGINDRDLGWYGRYERLWGELNARGAALMRDELRR